MRVRTTSTQRTYRYVRLSLVGSSLLLAISLGRQIAAGGVLPSISAAYYTPAGTILVGTLFAVSVALLALSGRSVEQGLLDVAAVLALIVAVVPTPVEGPPCPGAAPCVPPEVVPTVVNNGVAVASVVLVGTVATTVLARVQRTASRGVVLTVLAVAAVVGGALVWALVGPGAFLRSAHIVAAVAFFVLIAAVAGLAAWRPQANGRRRRRLRTAYAVVAVGIALTLVGLVTVLVLDGGGGGVLGGFPVVFIGEAVALALFLVFWVVQTIELWNEADPALRARGA